MGGAMEDVIEDSMDSTITGNIVNTNENAFKAV